jgi:hypothetical protein
MAQVNRPADRSAHATADQVAGRIGGVGTGPHPNRHLYLTRRTSSTLAFVVLLAAQEGGITLVAGVLPPLEGEAYPATR